MKRLYLAVLMILLLISATGCSINKGELNKPAAKSTAVTAQAEKPADKTATVSEQEKKEAKNNVSSEKNPVEIPQPGQINKTASNVTLLITRDFGRQVLLKKQAAINNNSTVIDVLKANSDVITKYDGGYVGSIQGLESQSGGITGDNLDWFYYINGICSDAGAGDYALKPGEYVWWDYHAWKSIGFVNSAVIGCYPEPFIHGYRGKVNGVTVMASAQNAGLAAKLEQTLKKQGTARVNTAELNNSLLEKRTHPTIVMGTWSELKHLEWLNQFNNAYRKTGTSVHFTDNSLELLDYHGNVTRTISGSGGIIAAAGAGLGDAAPLWIIAGTDENGLQQALEVLVKTPGEISGFYSAAVIPGEIIRLPLK